jgi:PKHD-type hydroxylase
MTNYRLPPAPTFGRGEHSFTSWENVFSDEELERVNAIGMALLPEAAQVGTEVDVDYRRSKVSWIQLNAETEWIFSRLGYVISSLNGQFYGFSLYGFVEGLQYTVYEEDNEGCYDWHVDWNSATSQRKLSVVVQLSDPTEYEGGDLQVLTSKNPTDVEKAKARAAVFPSFILHRVTPVTKGVRRTLVAWICGDAFK